MNDTQHVLAIIAFVAAAVLFLVSLVAPPRSGQSTPAGLFFVAVGLLVEVW